MPALERLARVVECGDGAALESETSLQRLGLAAAVRLGPRCPRLAAAHAIADPDVIIALLYDRLRNAAAGLLESVDELVKILESKGVI